MVERHGGADPEVERLLRWLEGQRRHVLGAIEGLDEEALHRRVLPSGWNCVGLLQHLALDVERFWFRAVLPGDAEVIAGFDTIEDAWQVPADTPAAQVLAGYRRECALADAAVIAAGSADAPLAWWPPAFGDPHLHTLRDVLLHVITETSCHAGHLDAVREQMDGKQWLVLT